jgi:hypothetical protein
MLELRISRTYTWWEGEQELSCVICATTFKRGPVYTYVTIDGGPDELCEQCFLYLADSAQSGNLPVDWPTREQYFEALRRYTTPYFPTEEDIERATREGHIDHHLDECLIA